MSDRRVFVGALYGDCLPTGEYAVGQGREIRTHRGPIPLPPGEDFALFVRLTATPTLKIAYKSHVSDATWEWVGGTWTRHAVGNGVQPHGYGPDGTLVILRPAANQESQGLRYYDPTAPAALANLDIFNSTPGWVTGTPSYNPAMPLAKHCHVDRLYEWTDRGGIIVGQGAEGGALVQIDGVHRLIEEGDTRFIQFHRTGDNLSFAITRFKQNDVILRWMTVAELRALPVYNFPSVTPPSVTPPSVTPPPVTPPAEPPMPETPPPLTQIRWIKPFASGDNPLDWPEVARIIRVDFSADMLCAYRSPTAWPVHKPEDKGGVDANMSVIMRVGSEWFGWPCDYMRPKSACIHTNAQKIGGYSERAITKAKVPVRGEIVGVVVSGLCRDGQRTVRERTAIWWGPWGEDWTETSPPVTPPAEPPMPDYLGRVRQARDEFDSLPPGVERGWRVVNRAVELLGEDFGLLSEPGGTNWNGYSIDIIMRRSDGATWDCLGDAEGAARPQWTRTTPTGFGDKTKWRPGVPVGEVPPPEPPPLPPEPPPDGDLATRVTVLELQVESLQRDVAALATRISHLQIVG